MGTELLRATNESKSRVLLQKRRFLGTKNVHLIREGVKKSKWKFKMAFAIRGPTPPPPPPLNGTNFQTFFYPTFFLLQLTPTYMKRILHFKNITFKSSYNWFKIDIHQQLRPLTANYLAMFKVTSTTIYTQGGITCGAIPM